MTIKGGRGQQLKMFMSASEIREEHRIHAPDMIDMIKRGKLTSPYGNPKVSDFLEAKRQEAEESGHAAAIRRGEGGIDKPLHLSTSSVGLDERVHHDRPGIVGGQHRLAVMLHDDPDKLLPVLHHESILDAKYGHASSTMAGPWRPRQDFPYS